MSKTDVCSCPTVGLFMQIKWAVKQVFVKILALARTKRKGGSPVNANPATAETFVRKKRRLFRHLHSPIQCRHQYQQVCLSYIIL